MSDTAGSNGKGDNRFKAKKPLSEFDNRVPPQSVEA